MKRADGSGRQAAEFRGRRSELLASLLLMFKGYRVLGRRVRSRFGEIDLIARSPSGVLCFIEVKARQSGETALASVRIHQQMRIGRAARLCVAQRPALAAKGIRFDVIAVAAGHLPRHFPGAWHPEDWGEIRP
ncbi:MAG TPA: YraN family protein [Rhizomicrobium sp.]|jgi:putative endonuclease|nr:YraN family protein [Rhizomicrobium sp.]